MIMDVANKEFVIAGSLEELKAKGRLVLHGGHRPILVVYDRGRVFALDNRCPHMGFPLERGSVEDGILTCHWHHARFDLESGCTFDLWADDVPKFPVELLKVVFLHEDDPHGSPLGSKGIGELGICGAGAAVINAIHNATGARIRDFPATPDKLLASLELLDR
jgi:nitrite reductase/ring-hydroxylating ferredoxin subunit